MIWRGSIKLIAWILSDLDHLEVGLVVWVWCVSVPLIGVGINRKTCLDSIPSSLIENAWANIFVDTLDIDFSSATAIILGVEPEVGLGDWSPFHGGISSRRLIVRISLRTHGQH